MTQESKDPRMTSGQTPKSRTGQLYRLTREPLPLETETSVFILANMLDFFATYCLLTIGGFHESNPIARWFLDGWGPVKGLLMYKLTLVTTVCLITQLIYLERPKVARGILIFGSIGVFCVVIYSVMLYLRHGAGTVGLPLELLE